MSSDAPARPRRASSLPIIWNSRLYRSSVISLFISGIAVSSAQPQLALFFVNDLKAPLSVAGLYYLTNIASPIIGFLIGRYSDRISDRLRLFRIGACVGAVGWVLMAASTQIWMPFVISVAALGVASAAGAQVYAAARDELTRNPTSSATFVISTIRMSFTAGWIVGPVVGSWLGGVIGLRGLLLVVAGLTLGQIVPLIGVRSQRLTEDDELEQPTRHIRRELREMAPLFTFSVLCMLALSGDTLKFAFLPLYMQNELHTAPALRGAVIATQPVFELLLIPVASLFARRFNAMPVMAVGAAFGAIAHLCYALSTNVAQLFLGQFLMSLLWACIAGLGVNVAQELYPKGAGVATSTFLSTTVFSSTLGGLIGSIGVVPLGLPHVFFVPAIISAAAFCGLVGLSVVMRRAQLLRQMNSV
ncbi:MFS transporter [Gryllotalpicola reticulitermitis]|uniref:MFS transporter n=1 Tax=Gryllotalpicola reticulitermitis TaxID=1184153 RepID=A0ABV8Q411_9MICO